jgi:hypothetical protein
MEKFAKCEKEEEEDNIGFIIKEPIDFNIFF